MGQRTTLHCYMVKQSAGMPIRSVDRTNESPVFGEEFTDGCCFHFREVGPSVDGTEMRNEPHEVNLIRDDCVPLRLH